MKMKRYAFGTVCRLNVIIYKDNRLASLPQIYQPNHGYNRDALFQCWTNCYVLVAQGRCPYGSKMSKTACVSILSLFSVSIVHLTQEML